MRQLLFLLKVAFICNMLFLITIALHFIRIHEHSDLLSTIITTGLIIAPFINTVLLGWIIYLFIFQHKKIKILPRWLCVGNITCWLLQLIYIIL